MAVQYVKEKIWEWFAEEAIPWAQRALYGIFDAFIRLLGPVFLVVLKVLAIVCAALEMTYAAVAQISFSLSEMIQMDLFKPDGTLLTYGVFINRFLPLTETFALAILICNIYVLVIVFRWAKSLIPMWSN